VKIIVAGCGRVGSGLRGRFRFVTMRSRWSTFDPDAFQRLGKHFPGRTVTGSAVDRETLASAGAERADGVAAATGSDEVNVACARIALHTFTCRGSWPGCTTPRRERSTGSTGSRPSPRSHGNPPDGDLLLYSHLDTVISLGSGEVDIVETEVPPLLVGRTVRELRVPGRPASSRSRGRGGPSSDRRDPVLQGGSPAYRPARSLLGSPPDAPSPRVKVIHSPSGRTARSGGRTMEETRYRRAWRRFGTSTRETRRGSRRR